MKKSEILALLISLFYLVVGYFKGGGQIVTLIITLLIFPLAFIFFSKEFGNYTGLWPFSGRGFSRDYITERSPPELVKFMGWALLLLPLIIGFIIFFL